jgi:hypothetical protein
VKVYDVGRQAHVGFSPLRKPVIMRRC